MKQKCYFATLLLSVFIIILPPRLTFSHFQARQRFHVFLPVLKQDALLELSPLLPYTTSQGGGSFIGEITNMSSTSAYSVTVEAVFLDPRPNSQPYTQTGRVALGIIPPNQASPVLFSYSNPAPLVLRTSIVNVEQYNTRPRSSLDVIPSGIVCDSYRGFIEGVVRNTGMTPMSKITVHVWSVQDTLSRGYLFVYIRDVIQPGGQVSFITNSRELCTLNGPVPGVTPESFQYYAQGE